MLTVLADRAAIASAQGNFVRAVLRGATRGRDLSLGFHGGQLPATVYYHQRYDLWMAFERVKNRFWNAFGFGDPRAGDVPSIIVEVNPPFERIDRRIAGGFAQDRQGHTYLFHRGKVGGGRPGIGATAFRAWYPGALTLVQDGERTTEIIIVTALSGPRVHADLADFVRSVQAFKTTVMSGSGGSGHNG